MNINESELKNYVNNIINELVMPKGGMERFRGKGIGARMRRAGVKFANIGRNLKIVLGGINTIFVKGRRFLQFS